MPVLIDKTVLMDASGIRRALTRISHEILEKNKGMEDIVLVGIRTRGVPIASRRASRASRASVRRSASSISRFTATISLRFPISLSSILQSCPSISRASMSCSSTMCSIRGARSAPRSMRPKSIQLAVLIDRGHRELPIRADYVGKNVPTSSHELVSVQLNATDGLEKVVIRERREDA